MKLVELDKKSGGGWYYLIPEKVVRRLIIAVIAGLILFAGWLAYRYVYLPLYAPYYVTDDSSVLHNRSCIFFGRTKSGFYTYYARHYRDCKICGGRLKINNREQK